MSLSVRNRSAVRFIFVLAVLVGPMAWGKPLASKPSAGGAMPQFILADPDGNKHPNSELEKAGLVLVVSAPTYHAQKAQRSWGALLPAAKPKGKERLVFLEDLTASSFKGIARNRMRKEFKEGVPPLLLLDEDGRVRTGLGVPKGETWVLAFDSRGQRQLVEKGPPSAAAAKRLWAAAQK